MAAAVAQADACIKISGCPTDGADGAYAQTGELHEGVPHYTNGTMHLYYRPDEKDWRINDAFTPEETDCLAWMAITGVTMPMGEHSWDLLVYGCCSTYTICGRWKVRLVTTSLPTEIELVERQSHEDKRCLQLEELDEDDNECDWCGEEILKGTMRLTCEFCDYDLCQACGDKR